MLEVSGQSLTLEADRLGLLIGKTQTFLPNGARQRIQASEVGSKRSFVRADGDGVNTGFASYVTYRFRPSELEALQLNLVRSHACGVGEPLSEAETRAIMLLRVNVLALGNSGCRVRPSGNAVENARPASSPGHP